MEWKREKKNTAAIRRKKKQKVTGSDGTFVRLKRVSNPWPLAPKARIIPLDHEAYHMSMWWMIYAYKSS